MIEVLLPHARNNAVIVGLEPSCLLTLRDEIPKLLPGDHSRLVAQKSRMFEEFIADETDAGRFTAKFKPIADKVMLHGHCHQKAFNIMDAVNRTLSLIPDLEVENIQSSCCGMAGSFGYHRDTIEVSKSMAELSLLPKIRSAGEDTLIIADGTSCRQQIRDGSGNQSIHVARVLQRALMEH